MLKKLALSALGVAAAALGPMLVFSGPSYWQSVRNAIHVRSVSTADQPAAETSEDQAAAGGSLADYLGTLSGADATSTDPTAPSADPTTTADTLTSDAATATSADPPPASTALPEMPSAAGAVAPPAAISAVPPDAQPIPLHSMGEALRFDISPGWVINRWPRVSTALSDLRLHGYRVPLVTGTTQGDLAGALTYHFNAQQQVQRITFHGTTGDVRPLVALVVSRYGLARRLANNPAIVLYEGVGPDGKLHSVLRVQPAAVISAENPNRRFRVDLVMERPQQ